MCRQLLLHIPQLYDLKRYLWDFVEGQEAIISILHFLAVKIISKTENRETHAEWF